METNTNSKIVGAKTPISDIPPFGDDRFPIMGVGLPNSWNGTLDGGGNPNIYAYSHYTKDLAQMIADCGCNIVQNMISNQEIFPEESFSPGIPSTAPTSDLQILNTALSLKNLYHKNGDQSENQNGDQSETQEKDREVYLMMRLGGYKDQNNNTVPDEERWKIIAPTFQFENGIYTWMGIDEPNVKRFNDIKNIAEAIRSVESDVSAERHPLYNNLFPLGTNDFSLFGRPASAKADEESPGAHLGLYRDYLNHYQLTCKPDIWSYDNYGVIYQYAGKPENSVNIAEEKRVIKGNFFTNMMTMRSVAKMSGKPFWSYVYTYELSASENIGHKSVLSAPSLRVQAFSAIALGAKGLAYWRLVSGVHRDLVKFNDFKDLPVIYETDSETEKNDKQKKIDAYYKVWYPESPIMTDAVTAVHTDGDDKTGTPITASVDSYTGDYNGNDSDNDQAKAKVTLAKITDNFSLVKCPCYECIKAINNQIHRFGHLFMRGKVTDFRCTNPAYKYQDTEETPFKVLPPLTESFTAVKSIKVDGMNPENGSAILLSRLEVPSSVTYIIVVNLDINSKHKVSIEFNQNMYRMSLNTGQHSGIVSGELPRQNLQRAPGQFTM